MQYVNEQFTKCTLQILVLLCLVLGTVKLQNIYLQKKLSGKLQDYEQEEAASLIQIKMQRQMPDLGFGNLFSNWSFLQFIQYYGDGDAREITGYSLIPEYFSAVAERDPYFVQAHLILSGCNSIYAGQPQQTVNILNKILTVITPGSVPNAPYLWSYKGVDEMLFLGDIMSARHSFEKAAEWALLRHDKLGDQIAKRNIQTAKFLATNPDTSMVRISAWSMILTNAQDRRTQDYILNKLKGLGAKFNITPDGRLEIKPPAQA